MERTTRMPGEEAAPAKDGVTALNNAGREDPNEVARKRERQVQATAMAATGGDGDIAPTVAIDDGPAIKQAVINGEVVTVRGSPARRDELSQKYGAESKLPSGTQVNRDGSVFDGSGDAFGYIGDIKTDKGWLVGRIIPYAQPEAAAPVAAKKKAA
jgi:hypothetical protein